MAFDWLSVFIKTRCQPCRVAAVVGLALEAAAATGQAISDLQASANADELRVEEVGVHEGENTVTAGEVRHFLSIEWP
jgi:hypothetical protein